MNRVAFLCDQTWQPTFVISHYRASSLSLGSGKKVENFCTGLPIRKFSVLQMNKNYQCPSAAEARILYPQSFSFIWIYKKTLPIVNLLVNNRISLESSYNLS